MSKNKKIFIGSIIIIILLVLIMFLVNQKSYYNGKLPKKVEGSVYYTDSRAQELFKSKAYYSLKDLKGHEVYLINTTINIDFYFEKGVDNHQIDNARSFALVMFALRNTSNYGESPYGFLLLGEQSIEWKNTVCRIYVDDKLNIEEKYDENGTSIYGALIYGEANDLLELYESELIMTFDIDNVLPSKFI